MIRTHDKQLAAFTSQKGFQRGTPLFVALVVTQHAKSMGLPLDPEDLVTKSGGQVLGLSKRAVQAVLQRHGINRGLASEGGRTSPGSLNNMHEYVAFLNELNKKGKVDLDAIETFWVERVPEIFAGKPFKIRLDISRSLRAVVRDVIDQAEQRQKTTPGVYHAGAALQHMVGAKLACFLGRGHLEHNSFSTADTPGARPGNFYIGDVVIHVTTSPGEAVIAKCRDNLNDGFHPILVTLRHGVIVAEGLASNVAFGDRIDIF